MPSIDDLLLNKSIAFAAKTRWKIDRFDEAAFPTESTGDAKRILTELLDLFIASPTAASPDPAVYFKKLIDFQTFVADIENSSINKLSWPLLQYCDSVWEKIFPTDRPKIFYTTENENNYSIWQFTENLKLAFSGLIPANEINSVVKEKIYCLKLSPIEEGNLPIYANIGHEFGHALWDHNQTHLQQAVITEVGKLEPLIAPFMTALSPLERVISLGVLVKSLVAIAEEYFADYVGSLLMGPAFALSLFEVTWGQPGLANWVVRGDASKAISGYPSLNFRMESVSNWASVKSFIAGVEAELQTMKADALKPCIEVLKSIPAQSSGDLAYFRVRGDDAVTKAIASFYSGHLAEIKASLSSFIVSVDKSLRLQQLKNDSFYSYRSIAKLLSRLHADIIPNIVPDDDPDDLLGTPASLEEILISCALYRTSLLLDSSADADRKCAGMFRAEKFTAKSLEVSLVQQMYDQHTARKGGKSVGSK